MAWNGLNSRQFRGKPTWNKVVKNGPSKIKISLIEFFCQKRLRLVVHLRNTWTNSTFFRDSLGDLESKSTNTLIFFFFKSRTTSIYVDFEHFVYASCGCLKIFLMGKKWYTLLYHHNVIKFPLDISFVICDALRDLVAFVQF